MTNKEILQADMLDILFEHRNKIYGAYALRKNYNNRLLTALAVALSVVMSPILFSFIQNTNQGKSSIIRSADPVVLKMYDIPPDPDKPVQKPIEKIKTIKSLDRIQIVSNTTPTDMPEVDDLINAVIGKENVDGKLLDDPDKIVRSATGNESHNQSVAGESETIFEPKEIPPSFPGGISAWLNFLRRYLQTPGELEAG